MTEEQWLIDEAVVPENTYLQEIEQEFTPEVSRSIRESTTQVKPVNLAVRLQDIMVW
ncbi:MAG: hypothetical protein QNJ49_19115 [Mastigocoleus sp. MO_167.B18]|uniref:hypothetical protein n=1 Tax=Mastigocoleus sp. MO_188.B34 TaxID=3036635 RepID=UPI00260659C6|nr:hypothetical protein [Mastigocoleus sp. MO_188.B34]MDJ0698140.1 hypothetical protein [Mastigocoleus sp. MO_188.B34]MDJ0775510.1 hypothetical protein [Mastigocoleus sp. MO_167.B18]